MADRSEIRLEKFTRNHNIILNPEIIRISVLKKKFVEQMPTYNLDASTYKDTLDIVGLADFWVLILDPNERFLKMHQTDYLEYLRNTFMYEAKETKTKVIAEIMYKWANETLKTLPQLFMD